MATQSHDVDRSTLGLAIRSVHVGVIALRAHPAATSGMIIALVMPRGPATASQALLLMTIGLLTGMAAGFMMRTDWAMLVVPIAHVAALELSRLGADDPTVDSIHLGTFFGILSFLDGRGVYGIFGLRPMLLGVPWGMAITSWLSSTTFPLRRGGRRPGFVFRRTSAGLTTLILIALAIWIAIPPQSAPVLDANGE